MNPDRLGTAQWADSEEVATRYAFRDGAIWLGRTMPRHRPIGVNDDRHVCLVAGTRSGKGTSVIIPNLCTWRGSVVVIDPTGDNATLTAPRRGNGNERTEGMGQRVQVLDPYGISKVEDRYRAQFNPLDMLSLNSRHIVRDAEGIAAALVPLPIKGDAWAQTGARRLIAALILYVLSDDHFKDRRNLVTVRDLIFRGDVVELDYQRQRGTLTHLTAFDLLWLGMRQPNANFNGYIAGVGEQFFAMTRQAPAQWQGVHDTALLGTNFINNEDMRHSLSCSTFSIRDLKTSPQGLSLYLTVPSRTKEEDFRWLRMIVSLVMSEMESLTRPSPTGHPTLMILDEFAGLQRMDRIESGIAEIAKYGVKLFLVLQSLPQLKNVYGDNWETFITNCGTKIFFGIEDHFTREYVSRLIGDTEVIRITEAETEGHNTNQTRTSTTSRSQMAQQSEGWSKDDAYKRMVFGLRDTASLFRKLAGSTMASDSRQGSSSSGTSTEEGSAQAESSGREQASTRTQNIHKRPLVTPDEVGKLFRRIETSEQSALYPGMAIALVSSHPDPLMVRRTNYFEDEFFDRCGFEIRRAENSKKSSGSTNSHSFSHPDASSRSQYATGELALPFRSVVVRILHDQITAIVGGEDGQIAAIDLQTGGVLDTKMAEEGIGSSRPGGGEIRYVADRFFFLERGPIEQSFFTLSHSGTLKTWRFDGRLRLTESVDLFNPYHTKLREKIVQAKRRWGGSAETRWSTWTVYGQDVPESFPQGIVRAKLTPDHSSILCLTDWFALYRCDLGGRLRDEPVVLGDAFAIESASADGSEVWVGRSSAGTSRLFRYNFQTAKVVSSSIASPGIGTKGMYMISQRYLCTGTDVREVSSLTVVQSDGSMGWWYGSEGPAVVPTKGLLLVPQGSKIELFNTATLIGEGNPLVAGHSEDIRSVDATLNGTHAVSIASQSLRIWDLVERTPVGGYLQDGSLLRHGLDYSGRATFPVGNQEVLHYDSRKAVLINMSNRSLISVDLGDERNAILGVSAGRDAIHTFSYERRKGPPLTGPKGLLARALNVPPPDQYFLQQDSIRDGRIIRGQSVLMKGDPDIQFEPEFATSDLVDLGHDRVAVLTVGHLAIYDTSRRAFVCGLLDISRPPNLEKHATWTLYSQLIASPDGTRLFVRGKNVPIRVYSAINLSMQGEIAGSAGDQMFLLPWADPRYVLFDLKQESDSENVVVIADTSSGKILRQIGALPRWLDAKRAVVLGYGSFMAFVIGSSIRIMNLVTGELLKEAIGEHTSIINSIHLTPDRRMLLSTSCDGTARFWPLGSPVADSPELSRAVIQGLRAGHV